VKSEDQVNTAWTWHMICKDGMGHLQRQDMGHRDCIVSVNVWQSGLWNRLGGLMHVNSIGSGR
jgi:hypothetical protein